MIKDVLLKSLKTHPDQRGFFREIVRSTDEGFTHPFGQWSHSLMYTGVVKAWHMHRLQTDWWYVLAGVVRVGLCDQRPDSPTRGEIMDFLIGENQPPVCVKIPPGVLHGCKAIQGPAHLIYVTSHTYNPADEIRVPFDSPDIAFDWLAGPPIT